MIKNIIFDLGKVLIDYDFDIFFQKIGNKPNTRTLDEANKEILLFEAGKIDKNTFFNHLKKIYGFNISFEQFKNLWCDVFWEIPQMIDLAKTLKQKDYNIFLLSNTDELHFPYIRKKFPSIKIFDSGLMLSYDLGYVKPDKRIFEKALSTYDLNAGETVFIDDRKENIIAAKELGILAIHHLNYENTFEEMNKIINLEDK